MKNLAMVAALCSTLLQSAVCQEFSQKPILVFPPRHTIDPHVAPSNPNVPSDVLHPSLFNSSDDSHYEQQREQRDEAYRAAKLKSLLRGGKLPDKSEKSTPISEDDDLVDEPQAGDYRSLEFDSISHRSDLGGFGGSGQYNGSNAFGSG